jgi:hypothetical protein
MEGTMKKLTNIFSKLAPQRGLYCVWIRAHDGENAPLIRLWIDPSMRMFETRAKIHDQNLAAITADALAALSEDPTP